MNRVIERYRRRPAPGPLREITRVDFSRRLGKTIHLQRGPVSRIETLGDAARLLMNLDGFRPVRPIWDRTASQILRAAASGAKGDIDNATSLLQEALRGERWLR